MTINIWDVVVVVAALLVVVGFVTTCGWLVLAGYLLWIVPQLIVACFEDTSNNKELI